MTPLGGPHSQTATLEPEQFRGDSIDRGVAKGAVAASDDVSRELAQLSGRQIPSFSVLSRTQIRLL